MRSADGSVARLTNDPAPDEEPTWSPDGAKIAFQSYRYAGGNGSSWNIYVMNAVGTNLVELTHDLAAAKYPAWRPLVRSER